MYKCCLTSCCSGEAYAHVQCFESGPFPGILEPCVACGRMTKLKKQCKKVAMYIGPEIVLLCLAKYFYPTLLKLDTWKKIVRQSHFIIGAVCGAILCPFAKHWYDNYTERKHREKFEALRRQVRANKATDQARP